MNINNNPEEKDKISENDSVRIPDPSPKFKKPPSDEVKKQNKGSKEEKIIPGNTHQLQQNSSESEHPLTIKSITIEEERTWAMLAHFSVLLNLVTGFLGGAAAIIIYFVYKDRSRFVAYHAMQSFVFQAITWLGGGIMAGIFFGIGSAFSILIIPLLCFIPGFLFLLLIPIALVYGIIGGIEVNNGNDFRYWQVGDWVREILEPKPIPHQ